MTNAPSLHFGEVMVCSQEYQRTVMEALGMYDRKPGEGTESCDRRKNRKGDKTGCFCVELDENGRENREFYIESWNN